jgi:hypothetical protein
MAFWMIYCDSISPRTITVLCNVGISMLVFQSSISRYQYLWKVSYFLTPLRYRHLKKLCYFLTSHCYQHWKKEFLYLMHHYCILGLLHHFFMLKDLLSSSPSFFHSLSSCHECFCPLGFLYRNCFLCAPFSIKLFLPSFSIQCCMNF